MPCSLHAKARSLRSATTLSVLKNFISGFSLFVSMVKSSVITLRAIQSTGKFLEISNSSAYILPSSGGSVIFNGLALGYSQGQVLYVYVNGQNVENITLGQSNTFEFSLQFPANTTTKAEQYNVYVSDNAGTVSNTYPIYVAPSGNPLSCLQQLPPQPTKIGSANYKVYSGYYYDFRNGRIRCCLLEVGVQITGAPPGDYFKMFYMLIPRPSSEGPSGGCHSLYVWQNVGTSALLRGEGVTDPNGNLEISGFVANDSLNYYCYVDALIAVADSSCENVYIAQLPQQLCGTYVCYGRVT